MGRNINQANFPVPSGYSLTQRFGSGNFAVFSVPGTVTFTTPAGAGVLRVRCWGAGGSGGVSANSPIGRAQGGAGGGYSEKVIVSPVSSYSITVGAGGAGVLRTSSGASSGNAGGTSSFGSVISSTGGGGGTAVNNTTSFTANAGGTGSNGDINYTGGNGGFSVAVAAVNGHYNALGGGSAAGPWGNGFNAGSLTVDQTNTTDFVSGGAGIGGNGGSYSVNSVGAYVSGGGGSAGSALNLIGGNTTMARMAGPDLYGNVTALTYVATNNVPGASGTIITSHQITPRFPGDFISGAGGAAIFGSANSTSYFGGNGGPGAGGGGAYNGGSTTTAAFGGNGGIFGGGGGAMCYNGSSVGAVGGNAGIAAGGGGAGGGGNGAASGSGGNGLIVVEW